VGGPLFRKRQRFIDKLERAVQVATGPFDESEVRQAPGCLRWVGTQTVIVVRQDELSFGLVNVILVHEAGPQNVIEPAEDHGVLDSTLFGRTQGLVASLCGLTLAPRGELQHGQPVFTAQGDPGRSPASLYPLQLIRQDRFHGGLVAERVIGTKERGVEVVAREVIAVC
jgi:hypothetical protein